MRRLRRSLVPIAALALFASVGVSQERVRPGPWQQGETWTIEVEQQAAWMRGDAQWVPAGTWRFEVTKVGSDGYTLTINDLTRSQRRAPQPASIVARFDRDSLELRDGMYRVGSKTIPLPAGLDYLPIGGDMLRLRRFVEQTPTRRMLTVPGREQPVEVLQAELPNASVVRWRPGESWWLEFEQKQPFSVRARKVS